MERDDQDEGMMDRMREEVVNRLSPGLILNIMLLSGSSRPNFHYSLFYLFCSYSLRST